MSDELIEDILQHHGVKGMHWGVRRGRATSGSDVHSKSMKELSKTSGKISKTTKTSPPKHDRTIVEKGKIKKVELGDKTKSDSTPSHDAVRAAKAKAEVDFHSLDKLSNAELQHLVNRMNLEQQYSRLSAEKSTVDKGHEKVKKLLGIGKTLGEIHSLLNSPAGKALKAALK